MKNQGLFTLFILFLFSYSLNATSINGTLKSDKDNPVYYANVILFSVSDSAIVDLQYSDSKGLFTFDEVQAGEYWLECRYIGYPDLVVKNIIVDDASVIELGQLKFDEPTNALDEVIVSAKKPMLEMKPDKIVLNVEGSITSSASDAFTLLRKAPGVVIDNNDNILMLGKGGVQIFIDGKPSPLSGQDLAVYLKSISSEEIESIEIITHPSAKYEAEGNAGIINIRLRRDKKLGTSGSINLSAAKGIKTSQSSSLRLTNRSKKLNTFGSLSYYNNDGNNPFSLYRVQSGFIFDQSAEGNSSNKGLNYRLGTDLLINSKHTLGFLVTGSDRNGGNIQNSETYILMDGSSIIDSILVAQTLNDWDRNNNTYNFNYKFDNSAGRSFNIDLDYGNYSNDRIEDQPNTYYSANKSEILQTKNFATESSNNIKIVTLKLDYEQELLGGKLGTGIKLSKVLTKNTFNFYNVFNGTKELDITRSNAFIYDERVNAAYLSYSRTIGAFDYNVGLRVEHTTSTGDLESMLPQDNEKVERDYLDFFPSFGLSYKLNDKNSFQLSYSRRLNRPSYVDLNPFRQRLDELTFEQGNPFLSPEYASSIQLSHSWNYKLTTSISYSHTSDLIARLTDSEEEKFAFITWKNIADQYTYTLNLSAPLPITSWWNSYTSVSGLRAQNKADFGEGKTIDLTAYTFNVYSQHNFNLPGNYSVELSGWYNSPSIWEGNFKSSAMYSIDFGIQKSLINDRLNMKLSVSDVFKSQNWRGETTFGSQYILAKGSWDSRRVKLSASYSFGNSKVKSRQRNTGLESEKDRIKN